MMQFQIQLCLNKSCPPTLVRTAENTASLFISTKFSQVMSRIQRNGFGATPFKSKDAPPFEESNFINLLTVFLYIQILLFELVRLRPLSKKN